MKHLILIILIAMSINSVNASEQNPMVRFGIAISNDKEQIAYSVNGRGKTSLIFIHGWSLDSRLWRNQTLYLSEKYQVIAIDLAGHGNSSYNREDYTMVSFANDIKAVIKKEGINSAILIGHSMGGSVIAEAAKLMPNKVVGIIGVDTSQNVALKLTHEELNLMANPFEDNFQNAMKAFVKDAFPKNVEEDMLYWVSEDMASAPKEIAINQFRNYLGQYISGESYRVYKDINVPVVLLNAKLWPTSSAENKKHIKNYTLYFIEETGHFPMLEKPNEFNKLLLKAIKSVT
ncbi:alpha/beta hydrolase [Pseudoalteromonas sp. MMG005]|uniref:alpha/beta fold hydrolase n=1 Tax=Pseudoalteromonas sp. MMG005 TaxID=2822682 RepID=UPI001B3A1B85|nr:alpha/beta hydrolase [Pseudoalteromonas sp. MMG005]MBQ4848433.1 alpha/beta hydrolase [Pseudoalteromonas sp. MMG005]